MKRGKSFFFRLIVLLLLCVSCKEPDDWVSLGSYGFSPNGDGIHELFILPMDTTSTNQMTIIDSKTNKVVLKVHQYQENYWNGKLNNTGKPVSAGLYNYYLEVESSYTYYGYVYLAN